MKSAQKNNPSPKIKIILGLAATLILISAFFLWNWMSAQRALYSPVKTEIQAEIQRTLDAFQPASRLLSTITKDEGCQIQRIGLGSDTRCVIKAQKIFRGSGDPELDLQTADAALLSRGLQRGTAQPSTAMHWSGITYSTKDYPSFGTTLQIFRPNARSTETASRFFNTNEDISLADDEYAYGITIRALYWSCSVNSFIQLPCPNPPTTHNGYY